MTSVVIGDLPMKPQAAALSTAMTAGTLPTKLLQSVKSWKMLAFLVSFLCHFKTVEYSLEKSR